VLIGSNIFVDVESWVICESAVRGMEVGESQICLNLQSYKLLSLILTNKYFTNKIVMNKKLQYLAFNIIVNVSKS
jgi:hypothetical protein